MNTDDVNASPVAGHVPQPAGDPNAPHFLAACQALEQRWLELHEEVLRLTPQWQHFLEAVSRQGPAPAGGQSLSWADGALLFSDLSQHAGHLAAIAAEAVQTCRNYGTALQRAVEESSPPSASPSLDPRSSPKNGVAAAPPVPRSARPQASPATRGRADPHGQQRSGKGR